MKKDSKTVISCRWYDKENQKEIKFIGEQDLTIFTEGSTWENEIMNFIPRWKNTYLNPEASSKMITSNSLKFDVQKLVNEEGQQYHDLQIMVKVYAQYGRSTKLAQVLIPENKEVPDRFVRLAFMENFRHRARIFVKINGFSSDISLIQFSLHY